MKQLLVTALLLLSSIAWAQPAEDVGKGATQVEQAAPKQAAVPEISPSAAQTKAASSEAFSLSDLAFERILKMVLIVTVVSFLGLLIAGATGSVVIWYDTADLMTTLGIFFSGLGGGIAAALFGEDLLMLNITLVITALAMLFFSARTIILSVRYNRNVVIGVVVGIFKIFMALFSVLILLGQLGAIFNKQSSTGQRIMGAIILGLFVWLLKVLVNGERVYAKKGWHLPDSKFAT